MLWRIIGSENVMLWIGLYPDELGRFIERLGEFCVELTKAQIKAGAAAPARRHGDLGRRGLPEGLLLLAEVLADATSSRS